MSATAWVVVVASVENVFGVIGPFATEAEANAYVVARDKRLPDEVEGLRVFGEVFELVAAVSP